MAFLGVDTVELGTEGAGVHHALVFLAVLGVGGHVNDHGVVLGQPSFEVGLLPLEFLGFGSQWRVLAGGLSVGLLLGPSGEAEELKVHSFDEVEVAV